MCECIYFFFMYTPRSGERKKMTFTVYFFQKAPIYYFSSVYCDTRGDFVAQKLIIAPKSVFEMDLGLDRGGFLRVKG